LQQLQETTNVIDQAGARSRAIEDGGHTWLGGFSYLPESIVGKTCKDIDTNEVI